MQFTHFMGVDVSKEILDITIRNEKEILVSETIANDTKKIQQFFKALFTKQKIIKSELLICLEQTGVYSSLLLASVSNMGGAIWVEDAVQIKQVMKAHRGKNDQLDAKLIAEYAFLFTGTLSKFTRDEAKELVEKNGGKLLSGVSANLNYLVAGAEAGSKLAKAQKLPSISIINEDDFLRMIE